MNVKRHLDAIEQIQSGIAGLREEHNYKNDEQAFSDFVDVFIDDFGLPNLLRAIAYRERARAKETLKTEIERGGSRNLSLTILSQADEIAAIANRIDAADEREDWPK